MHPKPLLAMNKLETGMGCPMGRGGAQEREAGARTMGSVGAWTMMEQHYSQPAPLHIGPTREPHPHAQAASELHPQCHSRVLSGQRCDLLGHLLQRRAAQEAQHVLGQAFRQHPGSSEDGKRAEGPVRYQAMLWKDKMQGA